MQGEPPKRRNPWIVILLVVLPLWLVVSAGAGLWLWYRGQSSVEVIEPAKFSTPIEAERLADDLRKLLGVVGPRNVGTDEGARGLTRASAMIRGALGPANAGYRIELEEGPETGRGSWPIIMAKLPGGSGGAICVVAGYDTLGGGAEANSSGVASVMAVARALAGQTPSRPVSFVFLPHAYDAGAPVLPVIDAFAKAIGEVDLVLVVEAMGAKEGLLVSSRDADAVVRPAFDRYGTIVGAEAICLEDDFDLASALFEFGLPAVRVATRKVVGDDEADRDAPNAAVHAAATRSLAGLVTDLATGQGVR